VKYKYKSKEDKIRTVLKENFSASINTQAETAKYKQPLGTEGMTSS